jgi:hypothetical protein
MISAGYTSMYDILIWLKLPCVFITAVLISGNVQILGCAYEKESIFEETMKYLNMPDKN